MHKAALRALACTLLSSPAYAQSEPFTGPRVEAHVGWDRVEADIAASDGVTSGQVSGHEDGIVYGVEAGYDYLLPNSDVTLGLFVAVDLADTKRCEEIFGNDEACLKIKRDLEVGGRIGGRFEQIGLVYVRASYVNGKARLTYEDFADPTLDFSESDTRSGYRLGAGIEVGIGTNAYVKAEYRWTDYGIYDEVDGVAADFQRHQVLGGIGFRF